MIVGSSSSSQKAFLFALFRRLSFFVPMYECIFAFPKNYGNFWFSLARRVLGSGGSVGVVNDPWLRWDASVVCESTPDVFILLRGGVRLSMLWCVCHSSLSRVNVCDPAATAVCISLSACISNCRHRCRWSHAVSVEGV